MYVCTGKSSVSRIRHCLQFQESPGGSLRTYSLRIQGRTVFFLFLRGLAVIAVSQGGSFPFDATVTFRCSAFSQREASGPGRRAGNRIELEAHIVQLQLCG